MWTASDGFQLNLFGKRALALLLVLGSIVFGSAVTAAYAAPQSTTNPPASAEERGELRRLLESRYEVLPVSDGIVLKPKKARAGIRTIEVAGDRVAVNGEPVSARTLRDWLGADANSVLRLQGLSASEQRQVFGLDDAAADVEVDEEPAPEPEAAPEEVEEETPAVTSDADTDAAADAEVDVAEEAPEPEAETSSGRHSAGGRVNVLGSVHVRSDEIVKEAIAIGGSATVDGEVTQDVVAVGGPVRIKGRVGGEVVSVGGSVYLGPNAVVEGNVTSVGGRIHREPGSRIQGDTSDVGLPPWNGDWRGDHGWGTWGPWSFWGGVSDFMASLMWLILMGLLACLTVLVARQPLERVDRQLAAQPWPSLLAGVLSAIFFWPLILVVTVLLAITVVGCVLYLLYPFLFLYLLLLMILGYSSVAYRLGRWVEIRFNRNFGSPYAVALAGVVAIQIWSVLASLLHIIPFMGLFAMVMGFLAFLIQLAAWVAGFGAVVLARFGLEPGYWDRQNPPVPPPPPYGSGTYGPGTYSAAAYESAPYDSAAYDSPAYNPAPEPEDRLPLTDPMAEPRWEEPEPYPETPETYPPPPPPEGEPR